MRCTRTMLVGAHRHTRTSGRAREGPTACAELEMRSCLPVTDQELLDSFSRRAASDSSSARVPVEPESLENDEPDGAISEMTSFAAAATCFL